MKKILYLFVSLALLLALPACGDLAGSPSETATPTLLEATQGDQTVQIFLIAIGDNGQTGMPIGCDDSVIGVEVQAAPSQEVLRSALEELLSVNEQYYGQSGLYNALYQSDLVLGSVSIEQGEASIHLSGSLVLGGVCDNPRVEAQLEETALQFPAVSQVSIFVNGQPLEEVLSLKGE